MTTPPERTDAEREAALQQAQQARSTRAELKRQVAKGALTFDEVIDRGHRRGAGESDELHPSARLAGRIEIYDLLMAAPHIDAIRAWEIEKQLGLTGDERLDTLSADVVDALKAEVAKHQPLRASTHQEDHL